MAPTYAQLKAMTEEQIIAEIDGAAPHTAFGITQYLDELSRRRTDEQTATIRRLTWVIALFALVSTVATVIVALRT